MTDMSINLFRDEGCIMYVPYKYAIFSRSFGIVIFALFNHTFPAIKISHLLHGNSGGKIKKSLYEILVSKGCIPANIINFIDKGFKN